MMMMVMIMIIMIMIMMMMMFMIAYNIASISIFTRSTGIVCKLVYATFNLYMQLYYQQLRSSLPVGDFRGGLPITIFGSNFDSLYGYSGIPFLQVESWLWPYIGIWVGEEYIGGPEFFDWVC